MKNPGRKPLAICVSGGMDSQIAYQYAQRHLGYSPAEILLLHFQYGQPYNQKEWDAIQEFGWDDDNFHVIHADIIQPELANVPDIKNYIVPARNMVFASIAGGLAETVWISGMKFENHDLMFDKNEKFFKIASECMTQAIGSLTTIESPFIHMSKTDSIKWALANGMTAEELGKSTSCYHPTLKRCGECSLCFKRWVATQAAGISEEYATDPIDSEEASRLYDAYLAAALSGDFTHYQRERIFETFRVLEKYRNGNNKFAVDLGNAHIFE